MANPFDQFDTAAPTAANPFDQFDAPAPAQPGGAPAIPPAGGGRGYNPAVREKALEQQRIQGLRDQSAQMGIPFARDLEEVGAAPELNELSMRGLKASAGASFTFDDKEVGDILTKQVGAKILQDPEGNFVAQMPSGKAYAINRPGISAQDLTKFVTNAAAFTPAGRATKIPAMIAGGAATQAAIEGGQAAIGGEINPLDIGMAAAAPVVLSTVGKGIKAAWKGLSSKSPVVNEYLEEQLMAAAGGVDDAAKVGQQSGSAVPVATPAPKTLFPEGAKKASIRKALQEGTVDGAGWRLDESGKVVADKLQRELIKKGLNDRVVTRASNLTKGDKQAAAEMLDLAENYLRGAKGSETARPNMVIGKNSMKRFDVVAKAQRAASQRIGEAVERDLKGKPVDISEAVDEFMDSLGRLGIRADGKRLNFKESLIRGSNTTPVRNVFEIVKTSYDDAADLHRLKQAITNQINYDSPVTKPIDREAEQALKTLRAGINDKLRSMSKNYASANDDFAKAAKAVQPFAESMGRKFDPESSRVENFVGQELRKTISNYAKSNELIENMGQLEAVAREFGGQFDDDLMTQVMLNSELERVLGSFAPGSLQGTMEKAGAGIATHLGAKGQVAKAAYNEVKDRIVFNPPSKEKLELIQQLRDLVSR